MAKHVVEELVSKIRMDAGDYLSNADKVEKSAGKVSSSIEDSEKKGSQANHRLADSMDDLAASAEDSGDRQSKSSQKVSKESEALSRKLGELMKGFAALYVQIAGSRAIMNLATQTSRLNTQLEFMSRRLGTATADIRRMATASSALGGSGQGMVNTMRDMNQSIQEMVLMGDSSMLPFMSALNVGMVDSSGAAREARDVILDVAHALEQMNPQKAYAIASAMGFDDDTINAMMHGRDAMQEMMAMQDDVYVSNDAQMQASRDLIRAQSILESRWVSLQTVLGNAVTPALIKVTELTEKFINYLVKNEHIVTAAVAAIGVAITATLIPAIKSLGLLLLPFAGKIAVIAALGVAFVALYDDYKIWSDGGKSLFDWEAFVNYIKNAEFSVANLSAAFLALAGDYASWGEAYEAFKGWLEMKGITDDGALSIRGLASAFVQLAGDIIKSTGILEDFALILQHIKDGEFGTAARVAGNMIVKAARGAHDVSSMVTEAGAGVIDRTLGFDPEQGGTVSSGARRMTAFGRRMLDSAGDYIGGDTHGDNVNNDYYWNIPEEDIIELTEDQLNDIIARIEASTASKALVEKTVTNMQREQLLNEYQTITNLGGSGASSYARSNYVMHDNHGGNDNSRSRSVEVNIDAIHVKTSANTVTGAAADGIEKAISGRVSNLDLIGAGL